MLSLRRRARPRRQLAAMGCLASLLSAEPLVAERTPTDLEREEFLLHADIGSPRTIDTGVTSPLRATLSRGGITHDAHIQRINTTRRRFRTPKRTYVNFRDSYLFNVAAYRLDRLLDLRMVPVSVERRFRGKKAAVTWWVDDLLMMEVERRERQVRPPDLERWNDQMHQARVFNRLVQNADSNQGNMLITLDWRVWLVDFTRAFRTYHRIEEAELLQRIDRRLLRGLQALNPAALRQETGRYLGAAEHRAVIARRDEILALFEARIAERGEAAVVCDRPGH